VHFHVTGPGGFADPDTGIEKIGAGVGIVFAGMEDFERLAVESAEIPGIEPSGSPEVMEE